MMMIIGVSRDKEDFLLDFFNRWSEFAGLVECLRRMSGNF